MVDSSCGWGGIDPAVRQCYERPGLRLTSVSKKSARHVRGMHECFLGPELGPANANATG